MVWEEHSPLSLGMGILAGLGESGRQGDCGRWGRMRLEKGFVDFSTLRR